MSTWAPAAQPGRPFGRPGRLVPATVAVLRVGKDATATLDAARALDGCDAATWLRVLYTLWSASSRSVMAPQS